MVGPILVGFEHRLLIWIHHLIPNFAQAIHLAPLWSVVWTLCSGLGLGLDLGLGLGIVLRHRLRLRLRLRHRVETTLQINKPCSKPIKIGPTMPKVEHCIQLQLNTAEYKVFLWAQWAHFWSVLIKVY